MHKAEASTQSPILPSAHTNTHTHTETQSQLQFNFILHCADPELKTHEYTQTHTHMNTQHTPQSSYCTVCCLLSTIQRTNQPITASVHRNPIPSKGHLSIQRFSFFPVLFHPLLFILVIRYFLKSTPFALFIFPLRPHYYYYFFFFCILVCTLSGPVLALSLLSLITHPGSRPARGSWL